MGNEMDDKIELLRNKLEKLIAVSESLISPEVVSLSQELDKLILHYYLWLNVKHIFYDLG